MDDKEKGRQGPIKGDDRIILHDQAAIAAYFDSSGDLVIEQADTLGTEGIIFVSPENLRQFAQAINRLAGAQTPAERMRRHREKKKSVTVRDVTRDAERDTNVTQLRIVKGSS